MLPGCRSEGFCFSELYCRGGEDNKMVLRKLDLYKNVTGMYCSTNILVEVLTSHLHN